ncbi:interferon-induced very large GTPase 1-like [Cervus elaphus]|uniref:interferon-induced very large GTPase 1-like n=1 Tax=Cervus elaphus TaxID=9860 RepID=UPI001CC2BA4B|nr:interferon-induced very large GTPase 1-like [Cervus elaphus]
MDTADSTAAETLLRGNRRKDLQQMLREVGLPVKYWLPKLEEHLGVTCAQALQYLEEKDFQELKSQARHAWERKALEKMLNLSCSNTLSELQESQVETIKKKQQQTEQTLQELKELLLEGRQQQEETVSKVEAELRQVMEILKENRLCHNKSLKELMENIQRQLNLMEGTLFHRKNLSDRELVRWASGGLALQGIYKTSNQRGLIEKREELLRVPKDFSLCGAEQGTQTETNEFTSSQEESMFTQMVEKLGFSVTASAKGGGWGYQSESKETRQAHSEQSYFCSVKFTYIPLASCHFPIEQLQLSKAALQELKCIEGVLDQEDPDQLLLRRHRAEAFFQRFGSHANQGPLHLGGIYWWKAISEGFQKEQLAEVKQQVAEALDIYIRGSYGGFDVNIATGVDVSDSHSERTSQNTNFQNLQTKVQLSVAQTGGPPEANGFLQWKFGLMASNQTWYVTDRVLQLVPVWDIILSNHRNDFKDPLQVANCLKDSYTALTSLTAQIQEGEELLTPEKEKELQTVEKEVRAFLENVKSWEVSDPEEQLQQLINFMQMLSQKIKSCDTWINVCLTDMGLQNFLVNTVNFCKKSSIYKSTVIKSQLQHLFYPHIHRMTNFPQFHSIMQWIFQSEPVNITQLSELIKTYKETKNDLMEQKGKCESTETVEEAQRKLTYKVSLSLDCFLNYLQETGQPDTHILLLLIASGAGYHVVDNIFHYLLGYDELGFLLDQMQTAQNKYQELKNICNCRAQAFLVLTGLTATAGSKVVSSEEKTERLALIRHHLGQSLTKEVVHVLTKLGADHDWENLEKALKLLTDGDYEAIISLPQMDKDRKELQSLFNEKKHLHELHDNENNEQDMIENVAFQDLLERLGLKRYYPRKMSTANIQLIHKTSTYNTQPCSERELPFYFLQKLLMLDYGLRYLIIKHEKYTENQVYSSTSNQEKEAFDPYEEFLEDSDNSTNPSDTSITQYIHPMDIQMAILHCADHFARQYILDKLSICQFALPLLIPNPYNAQIEFCLWSLRQIRRSWQQEGKSINEQKDNYMNHRMCHVSVPIVSFIRVGTGFSASKSQIMNCLLSERKHDVFFHRHCKGSSRDCLLMGGVVEVAWFCPRGEEQDRFDKCLTFTNLHGDAKEHEKQLAFLQEVSSIIVVLMSTSDDNKGNRKIVSDMWQSSRPLILLLDDRGKGTVNYSSPKVRIGIRNRNEAELIEELTTAIGHLLKLSNTALSLENCAQVARKQGMLIDEDQRDCKEAKEKAEALMTLLREMGIPQVKENLLPLQGKLWQRWCEKDRELYHLREKGNRSIEQHKSETETEKKMIRQEQLKKTIPLNVLMGSVLEILQNHSETHTKLYFLQWLKVALDKLTAGHLENLNEKKKALVQKEKQEATKSSALKDCQNEIEAISREINDCTLGIEHILTEAGQIYETLEEDSSMKNTLFLSLPHIAADLMISGVPIELMDGDVSYVPLRWVAAVFDKLSEKLGNKRLFVVSVLGLQSSGKSTLLNALFGLQFTVSAGRCTRGAYMQLLKVEETFTAELGFDFVLVVDTEGLRAPELSNKSQNHDNELATFVIGLGNLTLINIMGENPSEMQDILQIVVQAFLRMKQVKISPSCLFVHQNVGEVTAKDKIMDGRRRLEQRLDQMAAIAAEEEQCSDVTCFSDVIKFDANNHVYYFAHLWDGNPPMAPPNPRYSHNVQELKSRILMTAQQESRGSIMKISDVKFRVQDLWRALLNENFIFSFRNTQEVMAMSKLETMYNSWTWKLRSHVRSLQEQLINQIQNGKIQTLETYTLEAPVAETYEAIKQELEKYFNEDPDREVLVQWKGNFGNKLITLKEALILDGQRQAKELISLKKNQEELDNKKSGYEKELLEKSRTLALSLNDTELSEEELHEKFNPLWEKWVDDVSSSLPQATEPTIEVESEDILLDYFKKEKDITSILKNYSREKFEINYDKHVKKHRKYCGLSSMTIDAQDIHFITLTTDDIISKVNETVNKICQQKHDYNPTYFHEILRIIKEGVKSVPTQKRYTFTRRYEIDLSLCLFQRASVKFKEMHKAFKRANDPVNYLQSKKDDFFMSFKISCQGATSVKTFVDFLWKKLTPAVSSTIRKNMALKIAGDIRTTCRAFNENRANLEKHILISLAEEENFDNYWQYLHQPESFFKNYIENHVKRYFSDTGSEKTKTFLQMSLDDIKNVILSAIHASTATDKDTSSTVSRWLDLFCDHLGSTLIFPRKDLISIEHQEIKDIEFIKEAMSEALDPEMKMVEQNCMSRLVEEMIPEIQKMLSEHLCGCWKQCPFCKAICTNTIPTHEGDHSVPFHRPQALGGWVWYQTDHFTIDFCTTSVASDCNFILNDGRKIPYKTYREAGGEYATWSITPDTSTQPYWKWFVCHFRSKLEEKYHKKFINKGEIPDAWKKITKQDVLDDLKKN